MSIEEYKTKVGMRVTDLHSMCNICLLMSAAAAFLMLWSGVKWCVPLAILILVLGIGFYLLACRKLKQVEATADVFAWIWEIAEWYATRPDLSTLIGEEAANVYQAQLSRILKEGADGGKATGLYCTLAEIDRLSGEGYATVVKICGGGHIGHPYNKRVENVYRAAQHQLALNNGRPDENGLVEVSIPV